MTLAQVRQTLVTLCHRAYAFGLTPGVSGNMSVRVPGRDQVVIKATGYSLGDITEAETLVVDLDGRVVEDVGARPSKEMQFHLAIYRRRPDVGAVVHLHPPYTLVFAAAHSLPPYLTGASRAFLGRGLVLIPPAPSGSAELARLVEEAFSDPEVRAAVLAEHGSLTVGADLYQAFYITQYLEDAARTAILTRLWRGREP
ncbi:MAG: class II aldolase/adducin family protein [Armatimonadota bacterium]|nr:class II aldolase/adducin family protein [Armatimonadota bacterium]